jgi:hypothetical protein
MLKKLIAVLFQPFSLIPHTGHTGAESAGSDEYAFMKTISQTVTPASVGAAVCAEQTFALVGVKPGDHVYMNPAATGNATGVCSCRVTAADTIGITFANPTAGALTPGAGTYTFGILRKASKA